MFSIQKVLLDPAPNKDEGGGIAPASNAGTQQVSFDRGGDIRQQALTSSPSGPVQKNIAIPEELKGKTFDISDDDFKDITKEGEDSSVSKEFNIPKKQEKKEEINKEESKKEEIKKEGLQAKYPEAKKESSEPASKEQLESLAKEKGSKLPARDFSIFPEDIRDELKQTSRGAFDFITKTYKEHLDIKKSKENLETEIKKIQEGG